MNTCKSQFLVALFCFILMGFAGCGGGDAGGADDDVAADEDDDSDGAHDDDSTDDDASSDDDDSTDDDASSDDDDSTDDDDSQTLTCYEDFDEDGYGNPDVPLEIEEEYCPEGWVENDGDCQDKDSEVNPGIIEGPSNRWSCFDEKDNDCDESKDEFDNDCSLLIFGTCADDPPPGAALPAPLPTYPNGQCPTIEPGRNTIMAGGTPGSPREFLLVAPEDLEPAERLPVVFMWHWLSADAESFLEKADVQNAVNEMRFLAVIPEAKGDLLFVWPFLLFDFPRRINEELLFFDHMLACVAEQYNVNENCVSSLGMSSGGAWTTHLANERSEHLSSFISLSGGSGQADDYFNPVQIWSDADHIVPAIVLWGGPFDWCFLLFTITSHYLENALTEDGHFFLECTHNCHHARPPLDGNPRTKFAFIWDFIFDHPYWLEDGKSPYLIEGLPDSSPEWCGIGKDSATIRQGACEHEGIFGECF